MPDTLIAIADHLARLGVPASTVEQHVNRVEKFRKAHSKIKRKRLYEFVINASGHTVSFKPKPKYPAKKRARRS